MLKDAQNVLGTGVLSTSILSTSILGNSILGIGISLKKDHILYAEGASVYCHKLTSKRRGIKGDKCVQRSILCKKAFQGYVCTIPVRPLCHSVF